MTNKLGMTSTEIIAMAAGASLWLNTEHWGESVRLLDVAVTYGVPASEMEDMLDQFGLYLGIKTWGGETWITVGETEGTCEHCAHCIIHPGYPAVWYPNDVAHPGDPDELECPHWQFFSGEMQELFDDVEWDGKYVARHCPRYQPKMATCIRCGASVGPEHQVEHWVAEALSGEGLSCCPDCHPLLKAEQDTLAEKLLLLEQEHAAFSKQYWEDHPSDLEKMDEAVKDWPGDAWEEREAFEAVQRQHFPPEE